MLSTPLIMRQRPWLGHGIGLLGFAVAFTVRWWAGDAMAGLPFVTFILVIPLVAAIAGTGPAITSLVPSFLAAWYFLLAPQDGGALPLPQGPIALAFFLAVCGSQIALVHNLRLASQRLRGQITSAEEQARRHAVLYRELQHRVANGIQSVASALSIQASMSPEAQPALDEAAERLLGVAEVHRRLHDPSLGGQLGQMLDGIVRQLLVSAGQSAVAVTVVVPSRPLPPETASKIGLIVAEAVSNSIKYAFHGRFGGSFEVSLRPVQPGLMRLAIEDDGPGFAAPGAERAQSLGMSIMAGFAESMGGTLRLGEAAPGGARLSVDFPTMSLVSET